MDWAERYRPKHLTDILGNDAAVRQMRDWAQNLTQDSHPLLITGKPGIGKTSAALALANDMNWEVIELNASDARTKTIIERVIGNSATTTSLFGIEHKLIIIDEVDNLEGNADRGGARAIAEILKETRQPIILIANDAYGVSHSIRKLCDHITFRDIAISTLVKHMREICSTERISCDDDALNTIAEGAAGDMRSAVNMLFASTTGKTSIVSNDINISQKDERASIFDLVAGVYAGASEKKIQKYSHECEEKPDTVMQWIEEFASTITNQNQRRGAYTALSRADVYLGRTMRRQYYALWRYATSMMTSGVAKEFVGARFHHKIMPPTRWRRMGTAKKQKNARRTLVARLGEDYNIPDNQIQKIYLDLFSRFAADVPHIFCERHDLDVDQLTILLHDKIKAVAIFKEAQMITKEKEIKMKKIPSKKHAITQKIGEEHATKLEKIYQKNPSLAPLISQPEHATKSATETLMPSQEEKKKTPTQATLDFF
ncbi:MAG: replication factor C large subunit [Methanocalculaceae archaeon]|jgi:replication factor C large subunit|nr:replication factor C large subunit [Methanocalculaceae archaeon]